jgi:hypothetical protein
MLHESFARNVVGFARGNALIPGEEVMGNLKRHYTGRVMITDVKPYLTRGKRSEATHPELILNTRFVPDYFNSRLNSCINISIFLRLG